MPDSKSATQNYKETTGFISVQKKKFHFVDLCNSPKAFYNPIIITPAVRNKLQFRGYMNATNSHGLFKNRCVCIILPENPAAERVSQNVFPLLLLLFRSLKSLWHVRGAYLDKWQLRWPPRRNITSEYPCAVAILAVTSSRFLPVGTSCWKKGIFWGFY